MFFSSGVVSEESAFVLRRTSDSAHYSGFDSSLYRNVDAEWHFSQENATSHDLQIAALESKPL
jgi:hypothetical protein